MKREEFCKETSMDCCARGISIIERLMEFLRLSCLLRFGLFQFILFASSSAVRRMVVVYYILFDKHSEIESRMKRPLINKLNRCRSMDVDVDVCVCVRILKVCEIYFFRL